MITDDLPPAVSGRLDRLVKYHDVALAVPIYETVGARTLTVISDLAYVGLRPFVFQGFEIANSREFLVDTAIKAGFRRLLFLDTDTVIDVNGFERLMASMDRHRAAVVGAMVRMKGSLELNAFIGTESGHRSVTEADVPSTLVPFPVHYVGLAAALLDLHQIRQYPGPRFARRAEGYTLMSENWLFARWCAAQDPPLDVLADPGVATEHVLPTPQTWTPGRRST